jgi:hypothetical protein
MKSGHKLVCAIIFLLVFPTLFSCGARGTAFQKVSVIPDAKGLVYIYRSYSVLGSAVAYSVHAGDEVVGKLHNGGYLTYMADPGELEVWGKTEARGSVTLDVVSGKEHYVKGSLGVGVVVGRPKLIVVDEETGMREIKECKYTQRK